MEPTAGRPPAPDDTVPRPGGPTAPPGPHFDLLLLDAIALTADPSRPEVRDCAIGIRDGRIA